LLKLYKTEGKAYIRFLHQVEDGCIDVDLQLTVILQWKVFIFTPTGDGPLKSGDPQQSYDLF